MEDELFCCQEPLFGCYVDASDRFDALGGNANRHYYKCLDEISICDNSVDCVDGSDEINCKHSTHCSQSAFILLVVCDTYTYNLEPTFPKGCLHPVGFVL